jgi:hypothetical protein
MRLWNMLDNGPLNLNGVQMVGRSEGSVGYYCVGLEKRFKHGMHLHCVSLARAQVVGTEVCKTDFAMLVLEKSNIAS